MSTTAVGSLLYPSPSGSITTTTSTCLIDATGEMVGFVFRVPKSGNIDRVSFRTGAVSSSQTLRVGLETLSSGDPSGTQYGGSAVGTQTAPAASTNYEVTLGTPATATMGDYVAAVIQFDSTVGSVVLIANVWQWTPGTARGALPYIDLKAGAGPTWGKNPSGTNWPFMSIRYDDGTYANVGCCPAGGINTHTFNSGSATDEIGNIVIPPVNMRTIGFYSPECIWNNDLTVKLYASDDTLLASASVTGANVGTASAASHIGFWNTAVSLTAGSTYRVTAVPGGSNISMYSLTAMAAAHLDGLSGGQSVYKTSRVDAGAWTNTTTDRVSLGLIVDQMWDNPYPTYLLGVG